MEIDFVQRATDKTRTVTATAVFLVVVSQGLCLARSGGAAGLREAAVYFSDGRVLKGEVTLTPGRRFKLNIPKAGTLKTTDMVTGEDVQYGKVRTFTFEPLREIRFYPEREEMERKWRFIEKTKYDEKTAVADYTPAKKEYAGDPYPVRYIGATVLFSSGESLQGHLYTTTVYLKALDKTHQFILRSKQRGAEGTTPEDLVYVQRIKLLDAGADITPEVAVELASMKLGPDDLIQAMTRDSLTPVPTKRTGPDSCVVESTFGESFYLAVRRADQYVVGWPRKRDETLFALVQDHVERIRDFYNERELLGAILSEDGREVLALVNLRRRVAPTNFGKIGGEWDRERQALVEPWRLSLWRWKYDRANQELLLTARGTFFRVIFLPKDATPKVTISEQLWQMREDGDKVIVGQTNPVPSKR